MSDIKISVDKNQLLETLRKNRDNHKKMYRESLEGFLKETEQQFKEKLEQLKQGKINNLSVHVSPPQDHTKDYDRAIGMMEWHTTGVIELNSENYNCFINDDWAWIGNWLISNRKYSQSATEYSTTKGLS